MHITVGAVSCQYKSTGTTKYMCYCSVNGHCTVEGMCVCVFMTLWWKIMTKLILPMAWKALCYMWQSGKANCAFLLLDRPRG